MLNWITTRAVAGDGPQAWRRGVRHQQKAAIFRQRVPSPPRSWNRLTPSRMPTHCLENGRVDFSRMTRF
ncbi:MAG: hypothetical protein ACLSAH_17150 [Bilophila wadsworthia]